MGHLSYFKGVDTIILAFKKLIKEIPDLTLIIANNSIRGDKELIDERTPKDIINEIKKLDKDASDLLIKIEKIL